MQLLDAQATSACTVPTEWPLRDEGRKVLGAGLFTASSSAQIGFQLNSVWDWLTTWGTELPTATVTSTPGSELERR
ncbi:Uncharacterised protein [Delftia tsuruhatensis]|nr:Uncharacterised protein [Delftia tsuruhatensis]CAC9682751.1 Uncharacterised protein [Delftia tsuruhatensis]